MEQKVSRKTNPVLTDIITACEEAARVNDAAVWERVSDELKRANRAQRTVNLSKIERYADDGDVVVVPGKVLGSGRLTKDVTVAALAYTQSAKAAINDAGTLTYIEDLLEENPEGTGIKVIG